jgi:hypothetical protein
METNTLVNVLVIILSAGFIILLGMSIFLVFMAVKIMGSLRRIAQRTEDASENFSLIIKSLGKKLAPMAATGIVSAVLKKARNKKGGKHE